MILVRAALIVGLLLATHLAAAIEFSLGPVEVLPNTRPALPIYPYIPDGQFSLLDAGDQLQMMWPGSTSYRTLGKSLRAMTDPAAVLEPGPPGAIDNGGAWLFSVFRLSEQRLLGFYHAEDHEFSSVPTSRFVAWKSIVRCMSGDNGQTWQKDKPIITSAREKPAVPTWGGCGDFCVVRDEAHHRWLCYYQEHFLMVAASEDPEGKPGSWHKYLGDAFDQPGLGGRASPLPGLSQLPGGNPSVVFSKALQQWLMVWHRWGDDGPSPRSIWLATSTDALHWTSPRVLLKAGPNRQAWYPTLLRADADGLKWHFLYGWFSDAKATERTCMLRTIQFEIPKGR